MKFSNIIAELLADTVHIKVFKILYLHSEGLTGRGLGLLAGTSVFKIHGVLKLLVAQGVVTQTVVGRAHLYRLNENHILVRDLIHYLVNYEDNLLGSLGKNIMAKLSPRPIAVILYGSIARGEESPASDIDLLLIYGDTEKPGAISETGSLLEWINRNYGNPASIKRVKISEFLRPKPEHEAFIRAIIKEGKSIAGLSMTEVFNYHVNHD